MWLTFVVSSEKEMIEEIKISNMKVNKEYARTLSSKKNNIR